MDLLRESEYFARKQGAQIVSEEAVDLALKREMQDLRDGHYSEEAMREFFRDMIGDLNGMYEVMSVNPDLLAHRR